jgi:hypothetical protein
MAVREVDYHYLRTSAQSEPRKHPSLAEALTAIKDLLHLQRGRVPITTRETDGKHTSRHPDGRAVQFLAENERGDVVS